MKMDKEKGAVLFAVLIAIVVTTLIATNFHQLLSTQHKISINNHINSAAKSACTSSLHNARVWLNDNAPVTPTINGEYGVWKSNGALKGVSYSSSGWWNAATNSFFKANFNNIEIRTVVKEKNSSTQTIEYTVTSRCVDNQRHTMSIQQAEVKLSLPATNTVLPKMLIVPLDL